MAHLRIDNDRGFGWQVRAEGEIADSITVEQIKDQTLRLALNGAARAFLNGAEVFHTAKLTKAQAKKVFGI